MNEPPTPPPAPAPAPPADPDLLPTPPTPPAPQPTPPGGLTGDQVNGIITERLRELASAEEIRRRLQSVEDRLTVLSDRTSEILQGTAALLEILTEEPNPEPEPDPSPNPPAPEPDPSPEPDPEPSPEPERKRGALEKVFDAIR